jgi:hypothetical protein
MTGYGLKKIPTDIFKFIRQEQDKLKQQRGTNMFSFETTVYTLLRDHPRFEEFKKKLEQETL